jgi:hypothetical protein
LHIYGLKAPVVKVIHQKKSEKTERIEKNDKPTYDDFPLESKKFRIENKETRYFIIEGLQLPLGDNQNYKILIKTD